MSEPPSKKQRICGTEEAKGDDEKQTGNEEGALRSEGAEEQGLETPLRASRVFAVLGLGNPGSLKRERHSLGARVAAALVEAHQISSSKDQKDCKDGDLPGLGAKFPSPKFTRDKSFSKARIGFSMSGPCRCMKKTESIPLSIKSAAAVKLALVQGYAGKGTQMHISDILAQIVTWGAMRK